MDMEYVKKESLFGRRAARRDDVRDVGGPGDADRPHPRRGMAWLGGEVKVTAPVLAGDTIRVDVEIADKRETKKTDRGIVTYKHRVFNQRGETVMELTLQRMIKRKPTARRPDVLVLEPRRRRGAARAPRSSSTRSRAPSPSTRPAARGSAARRRPVTDDGVLLLMPAWRLAADGLALGTKLVTLYPDNQRARRTDHPRHLRADGRPHGVPLALMDAGLPHRAPHRRRLGARRALSRAQRRDDAPLLRRRRAGRLPAALPDRGAPHPARRGRRPRSRRARRFAESWTTRLGLPVTVRPTGRAVARADVITCATTATTPLFDGRRLRAGVHVDAVGTFQPTARELDGETIRRARVVVDQPATVDGAGDIAIPIRDGVIARSHVVGELADVVSGTVAGRTRADEITVFKSEGFALEDLVAARLAYTGAKARGLGREVEL